MSKTSSDSPQSPQSPEQRPQSKQRASFSPSSPLSPLRISSNNSGSNLASYQNGTASTFNIDAISPPSGFVDTNSTNPVITLGMAFDVDEADSPQHQSAGNRHKHSEPPSLKIDTGSVEAQPPPTTSAKKSKEKKSKRSASKRLHVQPHIEDYLPDLNLGGGLEDILEQQSQSRGNGHQQTTRDNAPNAPRSQMPQVPEVPGTILEVSSESTPEPKLDKVTMKNVVNLTSLLLDTRKSLRTDYHVVENNDNGHQNGNTSIGADSTMASLSHAPIKASSATRNRAEKVRSMIGLNYLIIQRYHDRRMTQNEQHQSEYFSMDTVYNPLQNIRNRKIRAKYHEYPKPLTLKTIPLASNMFSSHNLKREEEHKFHHHSSHHRYHRKDGKKDDKPWKMLWTVELEEKAADITWQHLHWHELRKANGDLWFPPAKDASQVHLQPPGKRQRLHDKLFNSEDEESLNTRERSKSSSVVSRRSSSGAGSAAGGTGSEVDIVQKYHITNALSAKNKRSSKTKNRRYSSELEDEMNAGAAGAGAAGAQSNSQSASNLPSLLKGRLFKKVQKNSDSSKESAEERQIEGISDDESDEVSSLDDLPPPLEGLSKVDSNREKVDIDFDDLESSNSVEILNINDVSIKPLDRSVSPPSDRKHDVIEVGEDAKDSNGNSDELGSPHKIIAESTPPADPIALDKVDADAEQALGKIVPEYKYLDSLLNIRAHYVRNIFPQILATHQKEVVELINDDVPKLTELSIKVNDDLLPEYESIYQGLLNEINTLIHSINEDYSIRIDNLLSSSDRSIGEINTSLSLELRKIDERIDRLNSSMFGSRFNIEMNDHKDKILKMNNSNNKYMYFFIENLIIILLRLTWIIVNIYKVFRSIILFFWRIITFFTG